MTIETPKALAKLFSSPSLEDSPRPTDSDQSRFIEWEDVPGYQQICKACERLVEGIAPLVKTSYGSCGFNNSEDTIIPHHANLETLRSSARANCHLCSHIAQWLNLGRNYSASMSYTIRYEMGQYGFDGEMVVQLANGFSHATRLDSRAQPSMDKGTLSETLQHRRTDHHKVLDLAKKWLDTCCAKHNRCRKSSASQPLKGLDTSGVSAPRSFPRRLIQIQSKGNLVTQARLIQTPTIDPQDGYLTLSHCWGGADIVQLTTHTLKLFEINIPLSELPKTFTDALFLTVRLGYRYIWIDSLCIIQDSDEDWRLESEQMGRIYWHSDCTIAAAKAHNSYEGLFSERFPLSFVPYLLPELQKGDETISPTIQVQNNPVGPLYTRAWVVQEKCLSRRTLHFAADKITWECLAMTATERQTEGGQVSGALFTAPFGASGLLKAYLRDLLNDRKLCETEGSCEWLKRWWCIVRYYTRCDLTFPSDRFEAIRGLVSLIQSAKKVPMVEGLWRPFLITELLWYAVEPHKERYHINAPSWSWLGIPGEVNRSILSQSAVAGVEATATVLDRSVPQNQDSTRPTLDYSPLRIQVTARLLPIVCLETRCSNGGVIHPFHFLGGGSIPDEHQMAFWDWYWTSDILPNSEWSLWALQVIPSSNLSLGMSYGKGLIILPVDGEKDLFQRVGVYDIVWEEQASGENTRADRQLRDVGTIRREFGEMRTIQLI